MSPGYDRPANWTNADSDGDQIPEGAPSPCDLNRTAMVGINSNYGSSKPPGDSVACHHGVQLSHRANLVTRAFRSTSGRRSGPIGGPTIPAQAWVINQGWFKGGNPASLDMINNTLARVDVRAVTLELFQPGPTTPANLGDPVRYLVQHGYTVDDLPGGQPVLAVPVDRGRLDARAFPAAETRPSGSSADARRKAPANGGHRQS